MSNKLLLGFMAVVLIFTAITIYFFEIQWQKAKATILYQDCVANFNSNKVCYEKALTCLSRFDTECDNKYLEFKNKNVITVKEVSINE